VGPGISFFKKDICIKGYMHNPCYWFVWIDGNQECDILDNYNLANLKRFKDVFSMLTRYLHAQHDPQQGYNTISSLLKNSRLNLSKFRGFPHCESQVPEVVANDGTYPSWRQLLDMCGLPLSATDQVK